MIPDDKIPRQFIALRAATLKYNRRRGLYTRVARELGVTPSHVRLCALGQRHSSRVEEALKRELSEFAA